MGLIELLVFLIVIGLVFWAVNQLGSAFGIPAPVLTVITVLVVIVAVLYLLQSFGVGIGPTIRLR